MPGRHCAIAVCNNNSVKSKLNNENIIYHRFPNGKDIVSKTTREEWIRRCRRTNKFNPDNQQICSIHFCETDYERDLQNELLNLPLKKRLKKTAVPTLYLDVEEKSSESPQQRSPHAVVTERKLEEILDSHVGSSPSIEFEVSKMEDDDSNVHWEEKHQQLLIEYKELENKYKQIKEELFRAQEMLQSQNLYYRNKIRKMKRQTQTDLICRIFKENKINLISKSRKRLKWFEDELSNAFTLRYYNKKPYLFIRHQLNYPLPGLSSLRRWAYKNNVRRGILKILN